MLSNDLFRRTIDFEWSGGMTFDFVTFINNEIFMWSGFICHINSKNIS